MLLVILFLILNSIAGYATIKVASDKEIVNLQNLIMAILLIKNAKRRKDEKTKKRVFD